MFGATLEHCLWSFSHNLYLQNFLEKKTSKLFTKGEYFSSNDMYDASVILFNKVPIGPTQATSIGCYVDMDHKGNTIVSSWSLLWSSSCYCDLPTLI